MKKSVFKITEEDVQFSAKNRIGRKLSVEELKGVERHLCYALEDWGNILGNIVARFPKDEKITS